METDCSNTGDPGRATRTLARAHTNTHTPRRDLHTADFCLTSRPRTPHLRGETAGSCGLEENLPLPQTHIPRNIHIQILLCTPWVLGTTSGKHGQLPCKRLPSRLLANLQTRL